MLNFNRFNKKRRPSRFDFMTKEQYEEYISEQNLLYQQKKEILIKEIEELNNAIIYQDRIIIKNWIVFRDEKVYQFDSIEKLAEFTIDVIPKEKSFSKDLTNDQEILNLKLRFKEYINGFKDLNGDFGTFDNMAFYRNNAHIIGFKRPFKLVYSVSKFQNSLDRIPFSDSHEFLGNTFDNDFEKEIKCVKTQSVFLFKNSIK